MTSFLPDIASLRNAASVSSRVARSLHGGDTVVAPARPDDSYFVDAMMAGPAAANGPDRDRRAALRRQPDRAGLVCRQPPPAAASLHRVSLNSINSMSLSGTPFRRGEQSQPPPQPDWSAALAMTEMNHIAYSKVPCRRLLFQVPNCATIRTSSMR